MASAAMIAMLIFPDFAFFLITVAISSPKSVMAEDLVVGPAPTPTIIQIKAFAMGLGANLTDRLTCL